MQRERGGIHGAIQGEEGEEREGEMWVTRMVAGEATREGGSRVIRGGERQGARTTVLRQRQLGDNGVAKGIGGEAQRRRRHDSVRRRQWRHSRGRGKEWRR